MINFIIRVDTEDERVDTQEQYLRRTFQWPTLPRIGESVDLIDGFPGKVTDIVHWMNKDPHIMVFVEVEGSAFKKMLAEESWEIRY